MAGQKSNEMWGGRFAEGPDAIMRAINASIGFDRRLASQDIAGSLAHVDMLGATGIVDEADAKQIKAGLETVLREIQSGDFSFSEALEDIHMNVEARLRDLIGPAAGRLHTARSRNDQVATDFRLWVRDQLDGADAAITALLQALLRQAEKGVDWVMPGFTHLQSAQPVTWGHHMMAYVEMFSRDLGRIRDARRRMNESPLGAAALAGTSFPIDRDMTAKALGFDRPCANSLDAVSDRDFALEFLSVSSICAMHLSRLSEELVIWSTAQFRFVRLSDRFSTGSSIMPQKKNPDMAELIRGGSSKTIANLIGLLALMKNLPLTYNRDLQDDKEYIFSSIDFSEDSLALLTIVINGMEPNKDKMKQDCFQGQITATDLADYLVEKNMPFRQAHEVVGKIVALAESKNLQIFELDFSELRKFSKLILEDVKDYLDPQKTILSRKQTGGTAPSQVKKEIKKAKLTLKRRK